MSDNTTTTTNLDALIEQLLTSDWQAEEYERDRHGDVTLAYDPRDGGYHWASIEFGDGLGWDMHHDEMHNVTDPTYAQVRDAGLLGLVDLDRYDWEDDDLVEIDDLRQEVRDALLEAYQAAERDREEAEDEAYADCVLEPFEDAEGYCWIMPRGFGNEGYCVAWRPGERGRIDEYTDEVFAENYPNCLVEWFDHDKVRQALIDKRSIQRFYDRHTSNTEACGPETVEWLIPTTHPEDWKGRHWTEWDAVNRDWCGTGNGLVEVDADGELTGRVYTSGEVDRSTLLINVESAGWNHDGDKLVPDPELVMGEGVYVMTPRDAIEAFGADEVVSYLEDQGHNPNELAERLGLEDGLEDDE